MNTFSIEGFAAGCKQVVAAADNKREAGRAYLEQTLREHAIDDIVAALEAAVPAGASVGEMIVHQSPELTMMYARVPGNFRSGIHNHTVCACIGQLVGEEQSVLYERTEDGGLRETETLSVKEGEVMVLTRDAIHHIENPNATVGRSLHLYAGDFSAIMGRRSLWSERDRSEGPFSFEGLVKQSAIAMKDGGNEAGLRALTEAIPATKELVAAL